MTNERFNQKYFLTEDQIMVRELAHSFAENEIRPVIEELDNHGYDLGYKLLAKAGELGFLGIAMPEEYGGMGLDSISQMLMMEEISKASASFGAIMQAHSGLGLYAILAGGTEEQKQKWLAPAIAGEKFCSFALTEPQSGSDSSTIKTNAYLDGDEWVLNGTKSWISNFTSGGFFVVAAKTNDSPRRGHNISIFCVDSNTPGLSLGAPERKCGDRAQASGNVYFDDCRIPKDALIGEEGEGFIAMMKGIDMGRLGIAAISLGIAQDCYDRSVQFANERKTFGKKLCEHQVISFYLADMAKEIDIARTMLFNVCRMKDAGLDYIAEAAAVKVYASEMCVRISELAIQIHGGNGYSEEYGLERHWRDSKLQTIGEGTTEICKIVMARRCVKGDY